ncbi:uncharacterized protein H6S33_006017 [Morchella sextelata]|uniref:uncharacterized protein n=1 Tax=Morchella sextelata TaxID=1174677 RepID=UPI001D040410|nr:uncharacterized protein H6S33_006017 [Morchella sextelata]KAH0614131.1 hypothetical protein H6S33_006017 [Morchella sextelata]
MSSGISRSRSLARSFNTYAHHYTHSTHSASSTISTPLLTLPNELLFLIASFLTPKLISNLIKANRYLALLLTPQLQTHALLPQYGETALWFAAKTKQTAFVRRILEHGSRVAVREITIADAMLGAVLHTSPGKPEDWLVRLLIENPRKVIIHDTRCGGTPMHWAAHYGHADIVRSLLEHRVDIRIKDGRGRTPLHWAAKAGYEGIVMMLLASGAPVDSQDNYGDTPLHRATEQSHTAVVKVLLENGANVTLTEGDGATALHWAAAYGKDKIALMLLQSNADTESSGRNSETPLHQAAAHGHVGVARMLLKFGAKAEAVDEFGWTPLHHAIANGHEEVAVLLESRVEVSSRDRKRKRAAIGKAIRDMNMRAVRWFLSRIRARSA